MDPTTSCKSLFLANPEFVGPGIRPIQGPLIAPHMPALCDPASLWLVEAPAQTLGEAIVPCSGTSSVASAYSLIPTGPYTLFNNSSPSAPFEYVRRPHLFPLHPRINAPRLTALSSQGYLFRTTISIGQANPRLVFEVAATEQREFVLTFFSSGGRKWTLVNPPNHLDLAVGAQLKAALPRKLSTDHIETSNLRIIEVKKRAGGLNGKLQI